MHEKIEFSLKTTICNAIRKSHKPVIIDSVVNDEVYENHSAPVMYGYKSYISIPVFRKDGDFFGALCTTDSKTAKTNTKETIDMLKCLQPAGINSFF